MDDMRAYACAAIATTEFEKCAERGYTFLLCGDVGVFNGVGPEGGVAGEGGEDGIVLVGSGLEGFCGVFVAGFTDLPVLGGVLMTAA